MSFSPQDIDVLKRAKAEGKTKEQALAMLAQSRAGSAEAAAPTSTPPGAPTVPEKKPLGTRVADTVLGAGKKAADFLGLGKAAEVIGRDVATTRLGAAALGQDYETNKEFIETPTLKEKAGAVLQPSAMMGGAAIGGGASFLGKLAAGAGTGYLYDIGQGLLDNEDAAATALPGAGAAFGAAGTLLPGAGKKAAETVAKGARAAGEAVTNSPLVKGALQGGIELAERVPRFVSKKAAEIRDAATRANRIATAPPPVANAIKAGVDERIINTVEQADDATKAGYKEIVRLAEESIDTTGTLKSTARPEIVAGEAASAQFKLVDDQRKKIGKAIGDQVKALSKDTQVPMKDAYTELDGALEDIGVAVSYSDDGVALDFAKTGFSKEQRAKIKELYDLATEGGDTLSPAQIHGKDRLFSQLQREARMEKIGDVMVEIGTPDGETKRVSLFQVFRDVYSATLEEVAPEIKPLNKQYRNLVTFTDEIEDTLLKSGKYETNSRVDPSEFAQTNLRRLFSEAQSAADYRAIAEELDNASRALGYAGAKPEELARFAYEIRKIYPETTPRTGFEGGIKASVGGVVESVLNAGRADLSDQQKALRELLEALNQASE